MTIDSPYRHSVFELLEKAVYVRKPVICTMELLMTVVVCGVQPICKLANNSTMDVVRSLEPSILSKYSLNIFLFCKKQLLPNMNFFWINLFVETRILIAERVKFLENNPACINNVTTRQHDICKMT